MFNPTHKRLTIVLLLGFSSGLPLSLVGSTLQAWYASMGMSIMATGLLSLIGLPYIFRVFWGPLLDHFSLTRLGKRRSWILLTQIILMLGFMTMACFSLKTHAHIITVLAFILACTSATQDMAIEAHRTELLAKKEYALGSSLAVLGYRLALLTSGGLALIIANYFNWSVTYQLMGILMLIGILVSLWSPETSIHPNNEISLKQSFYHSVRELVTRDGFIPLILFILFYKLGEAFTTTTSGIVMPFLIQGKGFSLDTIGFVNKIMGVSAVLLGGLCAGFLMLRLSLYRALFVFGLMQAVTNILFVLLASFDKNIILLAVAVVSDNFAAGMGTTALVAMFMNVVNQQFTATQFSILAAISTIPRVLSGPLAAYIQSHLGWIGMYQLSVIIALGFIPFLFMIKQMIGRDVLLNKPQKMVVT